jgi:hypothetical protein
LHLLSEVAFGTPVQAPPSGQPDLCVKYETAGPPWEEELAGENLAEQRLASGELRYQLVRDGSGYHLRVHKVADFFMDDSVCRLACRPWPHVLPGLAEAVLQATVLAFALSLRGHTVLHASAVLADGSALAFAGPSGAGKSTVAALLCAGGATLLADDLVRIEPGPCLVGTGPGTSLRLRNGARRAVELFEVRPPSHEAVDNRLVIQPPSGGDHPRRLRALVFPVLVAGSGELRAGRVQGAGSVVQLVRAARIGGWQAHDFQRRFFEAMVKVAQEVPAWRLTVPCGPPLEPLAPSAVMAALDRR